MHVQVNGTRLWFDVESPAVVLDGREMRERPTVVLVHGGPGSDDHSYFKPDFARLSACAQVIYLDLRGHGRSAWGDPAHGALKCAPTTSVRSATSKHAKAGRVRPLDGRLRRHAVRDAPLRSRFGAGASVDDGSF